MFCIGVGLRRANSSFRAGLFSRHHVVSAPQCPDYFEVAAGLHISRDDVPKFVMAMLATERAQWRIQADSLKLQADSLKEKLNDKEAMLKVQERMLKDREDLLVFQKTEGLRLVGQLHIRGLLDSLEKDFRRTLSKQKEVRSLSRRDLWVQAFGRERELAKKLANCMQWIAVPIGSQSIDDALAAAIVSLYGLASGHTHPRAEASKLAEVPGLTQNEQCLVTALCERFHVDAEQVLTGEDVLKVADEDQEP